MEGYGQPAQGYGGDPYAAQAYGDGMGAYGALDPNAAAAAAWDPTGGAHHGAHHHPSNRWRNICSNPRATASRTFNHTLSDAAERAGRYPDPITALAFDRAQELLYAGTADGRLTVFHAPSLERHAARWAHPTATAPDGSTTGTRPCSTSRRSSPRGRRNRLRVVDARACHSTGAVKRWSHDPGLKDPANDPLTASARARLRRNTVVMRTTPDPPSRAPPPSSAGWPRRSRRSTSARAL